jgi:hypothetical protein
MIKQDNVSRIGPVELGKGYPINKPNQPNVYPPDLFTAFINLKTANEEVAHRFCKRYKIVPRNIEKGWLNGLLKEQAIIKEILSKIISNAITQADLDKINLEIRGIRTQLIFVKGKKLTQINEELTRLSKGDGTAYFASLNKSKETLIPIEVKIHPNTISALYEELVKRIIKKRAVKGCPGCGRFFIPNKHTPWQKFCEDKNCKERYHARKKYDKKRMLRKTK